MKINIASGDSLTAVQAAVVTTTAPTAKVDYNDPGPQTVMKALNGVSAVTLLSGPTNGVRTVDGLSIVNGDTVTQTVTINHVQGGTAFAVAIMTLLAGETLVIGPTGINVLDSSGNVKLAFASSATTFTGDVTLSGGKDLIFVGTTGQSEIQLTDNLADALSLKIVAGADLMVWDTRTAAVACTITTSAAAGVTFAGHVTMGDGKNLIFNATTGTKIGATGDKIGFLGATPIVQRSAYTQTYSTADKTHANPTATALTVTDGTGTNDGTIGAITNNTSTITAVQELAAAINALIVDVADTKQLVNSVIDDLQALGLVG